MSGGFGFSQSKSKDKARDLTPREFVAQRGFVADELRDRAAGNVRGIEGPFAAPLQGPELRAFEDFNANAFGQAGLGAAADAQLRATLGDPQANPFLQEVINAAVRPLIQNEQLNELRSRANFTGSGQKIQSSSAFVEDRNRSLRDTERQIADVGAQIAFQERQNQLAAVSLANDRLAEQREGIAQLALPRLIEQFGIDKGNEELARRFQVIEAALTNLASLTTPTPVTLRESDSASFQTSGGFKGGGGGGE